MTIRKHRVDIWRNSKDEWIHRFTHWNGRVLVRQSEGVKQRRTAINSAIEAYNLITLAAPIRYGRCATGRADVVVYLHKPPATPPRPSRQGRSKTSTSKSSASKQGGRSR